ncbi:hypothetical protein D3C72_2476970 [compost metagenome]
MARKWQLAFEGRADHMDVEMAATIARAFMPGMPMAVVLHLQQFRVQRLLQGRADALDPVHGRTLRNGRTCTRV